MTDESAHCSQLKFLAWNDTCGFEPGPPYIPPISTHVAHQHFTATLAAKHLAEISLDTCFDYPLRALAFIKLLLLLPGVMIQCVRICSSKMHIRYDLLNYFRTRKVPSRRRVGQARLSLELSEVRNDPNDRCQSFVCAKKDFINSMKVAPLTAL